MAPFLEESINLFPVLPQGLRTRVVMAPSHGLRLRRSGRRFVSVSLEQGSALSVRSFLSLHHILAFVRSELEFTLVSSLTAALLG